MLSCLLVSAPLGAQDVGLPIGTKPPAVTVADLDGKPVVLAQLIGNKPALIEFWATWCPLCQALEPRLKAAHERYGKRVNFIAVAVAVNETPASVRRHLAERPMPFPFVWDSGGNAVRAFQAPTTSYIVILDSAGRVAYTGTGEDQDIDQALAHATATD